MWNENEWNLGVTWGECVGGSYLNHGPFQVNKSISTREACKGVLNVEIDHVKEMLPISMSKQVKLVTYMRKAVWKGILR